MKITSTWLKDHLKTSANIEKIVSTLNNIGLEVENVGAADKNNFFLVAKIIKVEYVNNGCSKDPIEAKFKLNFEKGIMLTVSERQYQTNCYPDLLGKNNKIIKYKKQFAKGSRLLN
jgi:hypothetical protein